MEAVCIQDGLEKEIEYLNESKGTVMASTSGHVQQFREFDLSDPSYTTGGTSNEPAAPGNESERIAATSSSEIMDSVIKSSEIHWSELTELLDDSDPSYDPERDNMEVFKTLQSHPLFGTFFVTFDYGAGPLGHLVVEEKVGEGGQAELFVAHVVWRGSEMARTENEVVGAEIEVARSGSDKRRSVEEHIELSRRHWSQLAKFNVKKSFTFLNCWTACFTSKGLAEQSNVKEFKTLHEDPRWGSFFYTFDKGELVVGRRPFAEGGQAQIFEAHVKWRNPNWRRLLLGLDGAAVKGPESTSDSEYVLKVFRKGTFLRDLKSNLPPSMLEFHIQRVAEWMTRRYNCDVVCGTLLKDGRFAFVLQREEADLRSLIDRNMKPGNDDREGPFSKRKSENFMYEIARGMNWLHTHKIIHRDLKASNVLVREGKNWNCCFVADYECSVGTIGTGFHRAPEILQAVKDKNASARPELFTEAADVYSYGMTCYEILTGKLPFEDRKQNDYGCVLNGQQLQVPQYVDGWICELLKRCWQPRCEDRPAFHEIVSIFEENSATIKAHLSLDGDTAHPKAYWSLPKTEVFATADVIKMHQNRLRAKERKVQRSKSDTKKPKNREDDGKEWEAQYLDGLKRYQRKDALESLQESEWVLKVFKKGTLLRHLRLQFPQGMLHFHAWRMESVVWEKPSHVVDVLCGTLLPNGRFAFLVEKEQTDLRYLIDHNMRENYGGCAPFSKVVAQRMMYEVALGLDWLHDHDIVHRDLKASNVLIREEEDGSYQCFVSDYETSIGVVGTFFWRAPEILVAIKEETVSDNPVIFSKAADVYSYGMVCYEVVSGRIPFEGTSGRDYDVILDGNRPELPSYVDDWLRELLSRCWHLDPDCRPSVREILDTFKACMETPA